MVNGSSVVWSGGGWPIVVELPMNIIRSHLVQWKKVKIEIDQKKLATLHYSKGWSIRKLADHFMISRSSIVVRIHELGIDHKGRKKKVL